MPYTAFHEKFPAIARTETRSFQAIGDPLLDGGEFGLIEMYCDEPGCDCRRVMFNVISRQQQETVAHIAYGWESDEFYVNWLGDDDPDIIRELQGPVLNSMSPQSKIAPALIPWLELILEDAQYVERIKRHYAMFRDALKTEYPKLSKPRRRRLQRPRKPKPKRRK